MKITNYLVSVVLILLGSNSFAQSTDSTFLKNSQTNALSLKKEIDYKFFNNSYDYENIKLRKVNDTLNIIIDEKRKISILATDITSFEEFEGFEEDIDSFFAAVDQLELDTEEKNYTIRFMPESSEMVVEERSRSSYQLIEKSLIPVFRHEVVFSYPNEMLETVFYLGDLDELEVLKEASISDLFKETAIEEEWYRRYKRFTFNKDLTIDNEGNLGIVTYENIEKNFDLAVNFGLGVGFSYVGGRVPFNQELSILFDLGKYNKWAKYSTDEWFNGVLASLDLYQFFSKDEENRFVVDGAIFLNLGYVTGPKEFPIGLYFGRLVSRSSSNFFEFNRTKIGIDLLVESKFRIRYEFFIGENDSDWINGIGISFPIVHNR
ncbi:hypothetical protein [Algoriphagus formosus]|uniref:hypothetical protein n=1 Tax=Algoriphagus formosus TaxID=2007308 RepID=UPI003F71E09C